MSSEWVFERTYNSHAQMSEHLLCAMHCFMTNGKKPDTALLMELTGTEKGSGEQLEPGCLGLNCDSTAY